MEPTTLTATGISANDGAAVNQSLAANTANPSPEDTRDYVTRTISNLQPNLPDPDALRKSAQAIVGPSQDALTRLQNQGPPAYDPPHLNPLMLLGMAAAGAFVNSKEPYHPPGAALVDNTLGGLEQGAQIKHRQDTQAYQHQLQSAQQAYLAAKDQAQPLLDKATESENARSIFNKNWLGALSDTLAGDGTRTPQQRIESLQLASQLEAQRDQQGLADAMDKLEQKYIQHNNTLGLALKSSDPRVRAEALYHETLLGKPVDQNGRAIDPQDEQIAQAAYQEGLSQTPDDLETHMRARLAAQKAQEIDQLIQSNQLNSNARPQIFASAMKRIMGTADRGDSDNWMRNATSESNATLKPYLQYRDTLKSLTDQVATSRSNIAKYGALLPRTDIDPKSLPAVANNINQERSNLARANEALKALSLSQFEH